MSTLLHPGPPAAALEGGPLVATRRRDTSKPVALSRTQMTRVAKAALLLTERCGGDRREAARQHGFAANTIQALVRMDTPWEVSSAVLERLDAALGFQAGDVLAGRASESRGEVGRTIGRFR